MTKHSKFPGMHEGNDMFPLGLLANGERAEVANGIPALEHGHGPCCGHCRGKGREGSAVRLEDMGIRPGKEVEMLNNGGGGALLDEMGFVDIVLIVLIVGGAIYLLYRSLWKKRDIVTAATPPENAGSVTGCSHLPSRGKFKPSREPGTPRVAELLF